METKARIRIVLAMILCLVGGVISGILLGQHHGEPWAVATVTEQCGDAESSGCGDVAQSGWSTFAGIPLAALGLAFYASLALLASLAFLAPAGLRKAMIGSILLPCLLVGLALDLFLLMLQAFVLHAWCAFCIATYILGLAALLVLLPFRGNPKRLFAEFAPPEGKLALAGWALAAVAVAFAVFSFNGMLASRADARAGALLGSPSHGDDAEDGNPGDPSYWQKRALRLEAVLDDPRRTEAYWSEQALREFDEAKAEEIDLTGIPGEGNESAPVTVVEYSDFLCPYCRQLSMALLRYVPESGGRVRVYFKNYPLDRECNPALSRSTHPGACRLALGAVCARRQGRFSAYHDRAFEAGIAEPQLDDVVKIGSEAGLSPSAFRRCLEDPGTRSTLDAEVAEANRLGVDATPSVYVNGKPLERVNDFLKVVDREARRQGFAPVP
ncbi:MAG: thioredoxin domain-containing protein [Acidobacteria bacterium]|nr:thioredoxin domain-containing protein [Acidobacteriota bacterium]